MVNSVFHTALGLVLGGGVGDVADRAALVETAHINLAIVALDGRFKDATVRELPQDPPVADIGLVGAVLGYEEGVFGKGTSQVLCEKLLAGVNHRFAAIVILDQVGKHFKAVAQLLRRPSSGYLHINQGEQVLLLSLGIGDEILKLRVHAALGREEMITAYLEAVLAGVADVLLVAGVDVVAALGSLDINKLDLGVLFELFPIDGALMLGHINAVELHLGRVNGLAHFGLGLSGFGSSISLRSRCRVFLLGLGSLDIVFFLDRCLVLFLFGSLGIGRSSFLFLVFIVVGLVFIILIIFVVLVVLVILFVLVHTLTGGLGDVVVLR